MTQPAQPAGYYPPQPPAPGQAPYGAPAPGYAPQPPAPGYPPQGAYAPPAPGYPPQAGWGAPPPGYPAPYGAPAPGYPQQAPAPQLVTGTIDEFLNQPGGSGAENITKIFANKAYGSVTVSFIVARKIMNTDIRQQTNAQGQAQQSFNGGPLFVMIVPCQVIGSTDGSHFQLFPDGQASWWVKGQPKDALVAAMSAAGVNGGVPEAGARIDLTLTGERPSKRAGHNPSKQYKVVYTRPAGAPNEPQPAMDASALQAPSQQALPAAPQQAYPATPNEPPFAPQGAPQQWQQPQAAPVQYQPGPAPGTATQMPPQQFTPQPDGTAPATYIQPGMMTPGTATQMPPVQYATGGIVGQPPQYTDPAAAYATPGGQQPQGAPQQWQQPQYQAPQQPQAQYAAPAGTLAGLNEVQAGLMSELRANGTVPPPAQAPAS